MGKLIKILLCLILFSIVGYTIYVYAVFNDEVVVTKYTVKSQVKSNMRIVQLTDLHNKDFGDNNKKLVEMVKQQQPNIIVMTGGMVSSDDTEFKVIGSLIQQLSEVAKVYFCYGNAESEWIDKHGDVLADKLKKYGAVVLDRDFKDIKVNDNKIRIGGYEGFYGVSKMTEVDVDDQRETEDFMKSFEDTKRFKLLLDHIPTSWVDWGYLDKSSVNMVLSGHYHGGIVRIPLIKKGLYVKDKGWFQENVYGLFEGKKGKCIISSGLALEGVALPRFNNSPEIVVVDLEPEESAEK
ncbi:MAG: hypothetical protein E7254_07380 [Lachnospiraceae bacterium]|nr:hypothetical protein [Lachnospiraceae bacterium]